MPGAGELMIFCAAMAGAGLAFLWFNAHPAQVFMGDVGALALGGALGTMAVIMRQEIVLAIMGGIFVVEALSVMVQVTWFKYTKKRTAKAGASSRWRRCTTISRRRGWKETQVVVRFWIITMLLCLVGLVDVEAALDEPTAEIKRVLVLGLGESGLAMARWCARAGAGARGGHARSRRRLAGCARNAPGAVRSAARSMPARRAGVDAVLRGPGLAPARRSSPPVMPRRAKLACRCGRDRAVRRTRWPSWSDARLCAAGAGRDRHQRQDDVTALTGQLVERAGKRWRVAGNIGPTMLDTLVRDALDAATARSLGARAVEFPARRRAGLRARRGGAC